MGKMFCENFSCFLTRRRRRDLFMFSGNRYVVGVTIDNYDSCMMYYLRIDLWLHHECLIDIEKNIFYSCLLVYDNSAINHSIHERF